MISVVGKTVLWTGLILFLISFIFYYIQYKKGSGRGPARLFFLLAGLCVAGASALLWKAILTHDFSIAYVYEYSSKDLPALYLLSSFWAGQAGSFLLWLFWGVLLGFFFIRWSGEYESQSMLFYIPIQCLLTLFLLVESPFQSSGSCPTGPGMGLNPLLQDPWMVFHPPVMFLGYAAAAMPFCLALAGFWRRDYQGWIGEARPWALFAWSSLGAGIAMGGYWAYKVLGWGGWWGWDPVENASLLPFLMGTALLHGLIIQKKKQIFSGTNFIYAVLTFVLVILSTYLTRSGVLAESSVHSFGKTRLSTPLFYFTLLALAPGLGLLFLRRRDIKKASPPKEQVNKSVVFFSFFLVLILFTLIVLSGILTPVYSRWLHFYSTRGPEWYNIMVRPMGILIGVMLVLCPLFSWEGGTIKNAVFNFLQRIRKKGIQGAGGPLAHLGAAMLLGAVLFGGLSPKSRVTLIQNEPGRWRNQTLVFEGMFTPSDGKTTARIKMTEGNNVYLALPKLYESYGNGRMQIRAEPYIKKGIFADVYIAPLEYEEPQPGDSWIFELEKTKSVSRGEWSFTFDRFVMGDHSQMTGQGSRFGAQITVKHGLDSTILEPALIMEPDTLVPEPAPILLPGTDTLHTPHIVIQRIFADRKAIQVAVHGLETAMDEKAPPRASLKVEISRKPMMTLLWFGLLLMVLGGFLATYRRLSRNLSIG